MNALALTDLRTQVLFRSRSRANMLDPDDSTTTGNTRLTELINQWKDTIIGAHDWDWRKSQGTATITASSPEADMPADFQAPIKFWIVSQSQPLTYMSEQEFRLRFQDGNESGTPTWYIPVGAGTGRYRYRFYPGGAYTVNFSYNRSFPDLAAAQDVLTTHVGVPPGIVGTFQRALIEGVLSDVFDILDRPDKAVKAQANYRGFVDLMIAGESDRDATPELERFGDATFPTPRLGAEYGE